MPLSAFHPLVARWFAETLGTPTAVQQRGWTSIRSGRHTLIAAPTGSGKTLAAFLTAIDDLVQESARGPLPDEVRVVYVSPLKALSADIHKNLAEPRRGIRRLAEQLGIEVPRIRVAVRTGDTPAAERTAMLQTPPHIVVTTPESLYLMLTAERSREMLRTTRVVILDEIHAVIDSRRGAHLALTVERLQQAADAPPLRIGLSATQKPIDTVARFLVGAGSAPSAGNSTNFTVVDEGHRRAMDLDIEIPGSPLEAVMAHEVWEEYYDRLAALVREHRTTLVFVNTRRMAERIARHLSERVGRDLIAAHHGSLSKETRLDAEARLKSGAVRALVATASLELGIDIGHVDLVCQIGSPRRIATLLQRVGRSGHTIAGMPKGRVFPTSRDDLVECVALLRALRRGDLDAVRPHEAPLDVLAQQVVAETACREYGEDELFAVVTRAWPYRHLSRADFDAVVAMTADGFATRRGRRGALVHHDEVNATLRARRGARLLAITSGGAIPEVADYRVLLDPEDTLVGTLNEDFAIESSAGDVFQLGNMSWRVLRVGAGVVRVADAHGAPPTLPFWLGEAPGRSDELSTAVSELREQLAPLLADSSCDDTRSPKRATTGGAEAARDWLMKEAAVGQGVADQIGAYLHDGQQALGVLPTQNTLVLERFFDESGGMQLVLHAPFGSRINKAWGLALRKRFCRQFNFELQAAATDDAVLLSLGPQHSFPLSDVFRYLHPATARDVLVQAFLDAPVFQTRWRWNTTIALAVPRNRGGRKVPPQLQRMLADDLMAAAFPDAAACLENIPGDREIPDHPLVRQTVADCLDEAMDVGGLAAVLARIHSGEVHCVARDTPEPSPLCHEILTARPYAYLDDAPLEERRTHAVYARRASEPAGAMLARLDPAAIDRVREEQRHNPATADELHDALLTGGFYTDDELKRIHQHLVALLVGEKRLTRIATVWVAAERVPEMRAVHPDEPMNPPIDVPRARAARSWTRDAAVVELIQSRLGTVGPTNAEELAASLGVAAAAVDQALLTLEADGTVLRGSFTSDHQSGGAPEWCDRSLLARIHRYTLNRLRAEIEPVNPADFTRFLFAWHHIGDGALSGLEGLRAVLTMLDGYEAPAAAWERFLLPLRLDRYDPGALDLLGLSGDVAWASLHTSDRGAFTGASPVALFLREHAVTWLTLAAGSDWDTGAKSIAASLDEDDVRVLQALKAGGASFLRDLAQTTGLEPERLAQVVARLAAAGQITSDGFAGLRALIRRARDKHTRHPRLKPQAPTALTGRWSLVPRDAGTMQPSWQAEGRIERYARALLQRYGIVFRRLLAREPIPVPWRLLVRVYRRLEAQGYIRGGRFVTGMAGEQFALPDAVERLREVRRTPLDGAVVVVSGADPLNLAGVIDSHDRVRAVTSSRIAYRDGVALAAVEGGVMRLLGATASDLDAKIMFGLTGRRIPLLSSGYVGAAR